MPLNITNAQRAEILTQALPYIQNYYNKVIVVKYGGNAMISEDLKQQVISFFYFYAQDYLSLLFYFVN